MRLSLTCEGSASRFCAACVTSLLSSAHVIYTVTHLSAALFTLSLTDVLLTHRFVAERAAGCGL